MSRMRGGLDTRTPPAVTATIISYRQLIIRDGGRKRSIYNLLYSRQEIYVKPHSQRSPCPIKCLYLCHSRPPQRSSSYMLNDATGRTACVSDWTCICSCLRLEVKQDAIPTRHKLPRHTVFRSRADYQHCRRYQWPRKLPQKAQKCPNFTASHSMASSLLMEGRMEEL